MVTMTHTTRAVPGHLHGLRTAIEAVLFWALAAAFVAAAQTAIEPRAPATGAVLTVVAILACAFAYMRMASPDSQASHALGVGIAWLLLSIGAEILVANHLGHGWFRLLGPPDHPLLHNVMLFAWIFAPAMFARRG